MTDITACTILTILFLSCYVHAQNDGRYRPITKTTPKSRYRILSDVNARTTEGRYNAGKNDGRYYPGDDGRYRGGDDGKYHPSDAGKYSGSDGKYIHQDNAYVHSDKGKGDSGAFKPDGKGSGNVTKSADGLINENIPSGGKSDKSDDKQDQGQDIKKIGGLESFGGLKTTTGRPQPKLPSGKGTSIGRNGFKILYLYDKEEKDGYHYIYETENGILAEEEGHIVKLPLGEGLRSVGFFQYTGDDGLLYRVDYVADDAGFVPQGAHLPKTPPHVIKLVEYLKEKANKKK